MNECCFKNSFNQDSLHHFVLIYSKDGAQSILENVFHNLLCENVEYWIQHSLDYIVSGHKSVVTLLIQLDIDQRDRMWTSILDLTFRSTRVRHWVMVAYISVVEKDSEAIVLFSRVVYHCPIDDFCKIFLCCNIYNQHVSTVSDQSVSRKMDLYFVAGWKAWT